ncbi:MAG: HAD family hydrolase [Thermoplasmata archaeon]
MEAEHLRAIIFDFHATLAYKEESVTTGDVIHILQTEGFDVGPQEWESAYRFVFFIDFPRERFGSWKEYWGRVFEHLGIRYTERLHQELDQLFLQGNVWKMYPEVPGVLKELSVHFRLGVATTIPSFQVIPILGDLASGFSFIGTGDSVGKAKGSRSFYLTIAEKLGAKPNESLIVGDDVLLDIQIPHSLGFHTIQLARNNEPRCEDADFRFSSLEEIETLVLPGGDSE